MIGPEPTKHEQCPTCGRFVGLNDNYYDVEPGGIRGYSPTMVYCNVFCAEIMASRYPTARAQDEC